MSEAKYDNEAGAVAGDASALLRNDQDPARRTARPPHGQRGRCILTQAQPVARSASPGVQPELPAGKVLPTEIVYGAQTRITCVDRAVIRTYFQPYDTSALARRKKGAGHTKPAAKRRNWDGGLLPEDLERRLTPLPAGYYRMLRGSAVLLVEDRTQTVIDAVRGVRRG